MYYTRDFFLFTGSEADESVDGNLYSAGERRRSRVYNAIISATAAAAAEAEVVVLGSSSSNGISQTASLQLLQLLPYVGDSDARQRRRQRGGANSSFMN